MSTKGKIKKLFNDSRVSVNSKVDDRILTAAITALSKSKETKTISSQKQIWRIVLKSPITKLAAAAIIIIAAGLTLNLWDIPAFKAYAVEQTIEAMRNVSVAKRPTVKKLEKMTVGSKTKARSVLAMPWNIKGGIVT